MFSVDLEVKVTCVGCGTDRELPDPDDTPRMPAANADGSTTLDAETPCRCGAKRVRVKLEFD